MKEGRIWTGIPKVGDTQLGEIVAYRWEFCFVMKSRDGCVMWMGCVIEPTQQDVVRLEEFLTKTIDLGESALYKLSLDPGELDDGAALIEIRNGRFYVEVNEFGVAYDEARTVMNDYIYGGLLKLLDCMKAAVRGEDYRNVHGKHCQSAYVTRHCAICEVRKNLKYCAKCRITRYCSRDHQVLHWKTHKPYCKRIQSFFNGKVIAPIEELQELLEHACFSDMPHIVNTLCALGANPFPAMDHCYLWSECRTLVLEQMQWKRSELMMSWLGSEFRDIIRTILMILKRRNICKDVSHLIIDAVGRQQVYFLAGPVHPHM